MTEPSQVNFTPSAAKPWWREWEVALLVLLVFVAYFVRAGALELRGEESRRAQVGFEMLQTGDWLVPREQGELFLSRPPLQNWLIVFSTELLGRRDVWAIRMHAMVAMLLCTLLIYGYARTFLPRLGALSAGLAFATYGEMFMIGCQAETECIFILLVGGSLLLWHWGWLRGWNDTAMWTVGYGLAGLGALAKGPQAPVYFVASTWLYLLMLGQWRRLLTRGHWIGAFVGAGIVFAWLIPFYLEVGWQHTVHMWAGDTTMRFADTAWSTILLHLVVFPLEIAGCTMPWSPLLLFLASPALCGRLREQLPQVGFMVLCLAIAFPTCWLPPGAVSRYFAPLYPCMAVLIGAIVQSCADAGLPRLAADGWRRYQLTLGVVMIGAGAALVGLLFAGSSRLARWSEPLPWALLYAAASVILGLIVVRCRHAQAPQQMRVGLLALATFAVVASTGYMTDMRQQLSQRIAAPSAELIAKVPAGENLVSFRHVSHLFAYYYGKPITPYPWPQQPDDVKANVTYFCFDAVGKNRPTLPFTWEEVGYLPIDRLRQNPPNQIVVVGRRLDNTAAQKSAQPNAN